MKVDYILCTQNILARISIGPCYQFVSFRYYYNFQECISESKKANKANVSPQHDVTNSLVVLCSTRTLATRYVAVLDASSLFDRYIPCALHLKGDRI